MARTTRSRRESMRILAVVGLIVAFSAALVIGGAVALGSVIGGGGDDGRSAAAPSVPLVAPPTDSPVATDPVATPSADPRPLPADVDYVALGDSYAAGLGVRPQRTERPACGRSTDNAASLLAVRLDAASFVDVSCAGASTADYTEVQSTDDPVRPLPQAAALSRDTDLVTVTLGGNDFDIFGKIVGTCVRIATLAPDGSPCRESYEGADDDPLTSADLVEDNLAGVLESIGTVAPRARIVVVGYPRFVAGRSCPALGFADGDATYAKEVFDDVTDAMARAAAAAGAEFVDPRELSAEHDICAAVPWFAGYEPTVDAPAAWHPGASYQEALAALLAQRLGA